MKKNRRKKLKKMVEELAQERTNFMRKHILEMALFWGVVRIVSKRAPLPSFKRMDVNVLDIEIPSTSYQAYELVDDRVS